MKQSPVPYERTVDVSRIVMRALFTGRPVELDGQEYVLLDKLYMRAKVTSGGREACRVLAAQSLEGFLLDAHKRLKKEDVLGLAADNALQEAHNEKWSKRTGGQPMTVIEAVAAINQAYQDAKGHPQIVEEVLVNGEDVRLDAPATVVITKNAGSGLRYGCENLDIFGKCLNQVDSFWHVSFVDPALRQRYPEALVRGLSVRLQEGMLYPSLSQPAPARHHEAADTFQP